MTVHEFAPAKVNLALHVTGRRDDGYHLLDTLVTFASIGDRLTFESADADGFSLSGRFAGPLPRDDDAITGNLVLKARNLLRLLARETGQASDPVHIHLEKNLPPASGIGGGSADAAATLRGLCRLWSLDCSSDTLQRLGLSLGADVPMCLESRPLTARGIGEDIRIAAGLPALSLVLVNPLVPVSTPTIFAALESRHNPPLGALPETAGGWMALIAASRNDLQPAACQAEPVIGDVLAALSAAGATIARMSGSGATCFGLFADMNHAEIAAATIAGAHPDWFVAASSTVSGDER
ncbi:4-(cytidine 5'-diphospho)-2-C-methyl-D-erythritol kinase [Martelella endophytica]|uniref:4-diphosphocytidyl-2-C-methyl-D-erythritol kinase n=1 Tax=Martelella endophytica TaxID=1486262 RepID=A0A0D5LM53_MAREN|nr:4-(cytidine 5'-diphospho)-2-C-methyl-D-erythritol kinase [Martelella endophytica]AJY45294.1 4-diphosphocytidyl-2C-methyl-D-erythritol kinase [Martelella endophytica]